MTLDSYLKKLLSKGKGYFTTEEAVADLGISREALRSKIYRLKKLGELVSPAKNLFIAIPPEHRLQGCIPAPDLTVILMKYWGLSYYVGLLSASLYHGAAHQKPQLFQAVVNKQILPIHIGKVAIEFIYKKSLEGLSTQTMTVKSGYLILASPEVTVMDLMIYAHRVGGLNAIATVLSELIEALDPEKIVHLAQSTHGKSWIQRLGWMLEQIGTSDNEKRDNLVKVLEDYLETQRILYIPAAPELKKCRLSSRQKMEDYRQHNC